MQSTEAAVARKAAASTRLILGSLRQALQSSRHNPIQAVTPASAGIGMRATKPEPIHKITTRNAACSRFATGELPPQRTTARLRAGIPTLMGAPNIPAQRFAAP